MNVFYPFVLIPDKRGYTVYIPDFDVYTQGKDLGEAVRMSKDVINLSITDLKEDGKPVPTPNELLIEKYSEYEILYLEIEY